MPACCGAFGSASWAKVVAGSALVAADVGMHTSAYGFPIDAMYHHMSAASAAACTVQQVGVDSERDTRALSAYAPAKACAAHKCWGGVVYMCILALTGSGLVLQQQRHLAAPGSTVMRTHPRLNPASMLWPPATGEIATVRMWLTRGKWFCVLG